MHHDQPPAPDPAAAKAPLVIIPTFNEVESLPGVVTRLRRAVPTAHILVTDDASPDGTGAWADAAASADPQIHVLHRAAKEGLGKAYLDGFAWGLARGFDPLIEMDADGSHRPEQLPLLLAAVRDGADLAIGSRWVPGGEVLNWPRRRKFLSRGGNLYVSIMLGLRIKDSTAGFRAYRADLLRSLPLEGVEAHGYGFQVNMSMAARDAGARITEVPISFPEREAGVSKMTGSIVREAMWLVTKWGLARRWRALFPRHRTAQIKPR
ncbi:MAG: polyprenol monophosphomannose synthase [Bifidobacteriaceae bacterium]|nr:polyprenol monophosphomannose synthase [Bifidobacteriaceae bacterium]